jgi:hypothetical protein
MAARTLAWSQFHDLVRTKLKSGTDVMILKILLPKNWAEKLELFV